MNRVSSYLLGLTSPNRLTKRNHLLNPRHWRPATITLLLICLSLTWNAFSAPSSSGDGIGNLPQIIQDFESRVAALEAQVAAQQSEIAALKSENAAQKEMLSLNTRLIEELQAALSQEVANRSTTDSQLQSALAAETAARQQADSQVLSQAIAHADARDEATLTAAKLYTDQSQQAISLAAAKEYTDSQIAAEAAARQAADQALQDAIAHEAAARAAADASSLIDAKLFMDSQFGQVADKLIHFSREGNNLYITGANLHIRSGTGETYATFNPLNGLGNLIIGYNELRSSGDNVRNGSHNLILGSGNNYARSGGFVAGGGNNIYGIGAVVLGGSANTANGSFSSVAGGFNNRADGHWSTIGGGANLVADQNGQHLP